MQTYLANTAEAIRGVDTGELENAVRMISEARNDGNFIWLVGNGGSASTAEHFANDLVKMAHARAIAIPSLLPAVLAYGNDNGWDRMFADLLGALKQSGDVLVAISCGGRSQNVLKAAELFHHDHLIVMTGSNYESPLAGMDADAKIFVTDPDIKVQEDAHLAICHAIAGGLGC